jgi:hypothetical protein
VSQFGGMDWRKDDDSDDDDVINGTTRPPDEEQSALDPGRRPFRSRGDKLQNSLSRTLFLNDLRLPIAMGLIRYELIITHHACHLPQRLLGC